MMMELVTISNRHCLAKTTLSWSCSAGQVNLFTLFLDGPWVKLAGCKSALPAPPPPPPLPPPPPVFYYTDRSKAVVPVSVLLFSALWFILRGDLF